MEFLPKLIVDGTSDSDDSATEDLDDDEDAVDEPLDDAEMPASTPTTDESPCILAKASTEYLEA